MKKLFRGKKFTFRNIRIGWKYGLTLAVVIIIFIISSTLVSNSILGIGKDIEELDAKGDIAMNISEMGSLTRNMSIYMVSFYQEQDDKFIESFKENQREYNAKASAVKINLHSHEQEEIFNKIVKNNQEFYRIFVNYIVSAMSNGNIEVAETFLNQASTLRDETIGLLDDLVVTVDMERKEAIERARDSQKQTFLTQIIFLSISIVAGITLVTTISRVISSNLKKVVQVSNEIAEGNLSIPEIQYNGNDEIGQLAQSISKMNNYLKDIIRQVSNVSSTVTHQSEELLQSANEVRAGAEQIAVTMQELSTGSEKQADSASELTRKMHSFFSKVQEANKNGEHIKQTSDSILELASRGNQAMQVSGKQMEQINEIVKESVDKVRTLNDNSKKIGQLVSVIREIADQTNLLALNAAIEAARAGEHGKGFSVVASEVRRLSEQVATSVVDISDIVKQIQFETNSVTESLENGYQEVQKGTEQITYTRERFSDINQTIMEMAESIQVVKQNLKEIAITTEEMDISIEEIAAISEESAAGIEETSASSQQTSSSMDEMAGRSNDLAKVAIDLNRLVNKFKL